jgi:V8-like Glu-specific endopeptidase
MEKLPIVDIVSEMVIAGRLRDAIDVLHSASLGDTKNRNEATLLLAAHSRLERKQRLGHIENDAEHRRMEQWVLEFAGIVSNQEQGTLPVGQKPLQVEFDDALPLEKIIGGDNLRSISWLRQGLKNAAAVCRISSPYGMGTGFLLQGMLVTNNHVLPTSAVAAKCKAEFNFELDQEGNSGKITRYAALSSRFWTNAELDITLVALDADSNTAPLQLWDSITVGIDVEPQKGDHVSIIQHANGGPKQIACTANQVVNIYTHRLQYLTDTLPGSSGAPVFDDSWRVVAVHRAGGNLKTNSRGETRYVNEGVLISALSGIFAEAGISARGAASQAGH